MSRFSFIINLVLFCLIVMLSAIVYHQEISKRNIKTDLIELNHIQYGLFSVDEWKAIAADIISSKIDELKLSGENKEVMRARISTFLYDLINDFEDRFYEDRTRTLKGILQGTVMAFSGTFEQLKKDVPLFTEQIIAFLEDPSSKMALRDYLITQLDEYTRGTFAEIDYSHLNNIIEKHGYENRTQAAEGLTYELSRLHSGSISYRYFLVLLVVMAGLFMIFNNHPSNADFLLFLLISLTLLIPGILLPMIEIDARIARLSFSLLDQPVVFQDQVLFYQSKSILEVVQIMFRQGAADMIFVGFLILAFSVLFPLAKLIASLLYIFLPQMKSNRFVGALVFKTGKWSMADVMVIAIFMAFIGFNGIVSGQLQQLESLSGTFEVFTTNYSNIMAGFFFFTGFVLLGLLLAQKLHLRK
jgi:hypothetical protein